MLPLKRPISLLAVSALALWYSVVPPKVAQHPVAAVTTPNPHVPRLPSCAMGSYVPEALAVCVNTNYTVSVVDVSAGLALAQHHFDAHGTIVAKPNRPIATHFIRRRLARIELLSSSLAPLPLVDLANFKVAGVDFDIIERVEGVFTIAFAVARFVKHRTGLAWIKLAILLFALSGFLVWDGFQLGESALLIGYLYCLAATVWLARRSRSVCSNVSILLDGFFVPIFFSIVDAQPLELLYVLASQSTPLLRSLLPRPWRDIIWPTPAPRVRKKKKHFKEQRAEARLASPTTIPPFWSLYSIRDSFILALPTFFFLPFDVPFIDIGYGLLLSGTIVDLLAHYFLFVRVLLYYILPPPTGRARRAKERYKRRRKGSKKIRVDCHHHHHPLSTFLLLSLDAPALGTKFGPGPETGRRL